MAEEGMTIDDACKEINKYYKNGDYKSALELLESVIDTLKEIGTDEKEIKKFETYQYYFNIKLDYQNVESLFLDGKYQEATELTKKAVERIEDTMSPTLGNYIPDKDIQKVVCRAKLQYLYYRSKRELGEQVKDDAIKDIEYAVRGLENFVEQSDIKRCISVDGIKYNCRQALEDLGEISHYTAEIYYDAAKTMASQPEEGSGGWKRFRKKTIEGYVEKANEFFDVSKNSRLEIAKIFENEALRLETVAIENPEDADEAKQSANEMRDLSSKYYSETAYMAHSRGDNKEALEYYQKAARVASNKMIKNDAEHMANSIQTLEEQRMQAGAEDKKNWQRIDRVGQPIR
jgi:tetratricopeptide (TPR) repeat protein